MSHLYKKWAACCLFCAIACDFAGAQSLLVVKRLGFADGLADHAARYILQDRHGFIWIATDNGLQQYDGYHFVTYHHVPGDSTSIPSDHITKLWALSDGKFLIATAFQGFCLFDPYTGQAIPLAKPNDPLMAKVDFAYSAAQDARGNLWMTGQGSLLEYDRSGRVFHCYDSLLKGKISGFLGNLSFDRQNRLWINGGADGVFLFDIHLHRLYGYGDNPLHLSILDHPLQTSQLYVDREDRLWVATVDGRLSRYDMASNQVMSLDILRTGVKGRLRSIDLVFEDRAGDIWLYADLDFFRYDPAKNRMKAVSDDLVSKPLVRDLVFQVMEDQDGLFWMASSHGIDVADPGGGRFSFHTNDPFDRFSGDPKETVSLFQSSTGNVWVMNYGGGLLELGPDLQPKRQWLFGKGEMPGMGDSSNRAWSMEEADDGKLWVGCQHGWLSIYNPRTDRISIQRPEVFQEKTITNMIRDLHGNLWFGLYDGIASWDKNRETFHRFGNQLPYRGFSHSGVSALYVDPGGLLWVGTTNMGLQVFDPSSGRYVCQYEPSDTAGNALSSPLIACIAPIGDSILAIGTDAGGINLFNKRTGRSTHLTAGEGLPSNSIVALDGESPGYLWVATSVGICRVRLRDKRVTLYGRGDGMGSEVLTGVRFCRLKDGRILAGCKGGFYAFYPDSIPEEPPPANVLITKLNLEDRRIKMDAILSGSLTVTLPHDKDEIDIDYVSLNYLKTPTVHYFYELSGYDQDWVAAGPDRTVRYRHLPAGHYVFLVRCENQEGISCTRSSGFNLIVLPPFWKTYSFVGLCLLAVFTLVYLLYLDRIGRIKNRQALRNRIAGDLHDDIGSSLSGINIYSRMALRRLEESPSDSAGLLSKISDRSERMMEALSDIVWSINSGNDHMENVLARMREYAAEMLEPQLIQYSMEVEASAGKLDLDMVARKELYLVYKEALNNAAKYAGCSQVTIILRREEHSLVLIIRDNGSGFDPACITPGNGLVNMQTRAKKLKATLVVASAPGAGTTVTLKMFLRS